MPASISPPPNLESSDLPSPVRPEGVLPSDPSADFRRIWHAIIERGWIVLVTLVLSLGAGYAYIQRAKVVYSSTATIQVQQDQAPMFRIDNMRFENPQSLDFLQTVAQSLKTRPMLEKVAYTNTLASDPRFLRDATNVNAQPTEVVDLLDKITTVKLRRGTRLIDVTVKHSDAGLTAKLANALVQFFIDENEEQHIQSSDVSSKALQSEEQRIKKKLEKSERDLQEYKEKNQAGSLDEKQNTVVAELKELSTKSTEAKSARIALESDYNQVQELQGKVDALITLPAVASDPNVVAARLALTKAETEFAALRQRYKDKHPKYLQGETQIAAVQTDLSNAVTKAALTVKARLDGARAAEAALDKALKNQEAAAMDLNRLSVQYSVLAREVESDRALYDSILKSLKETTVSKEIKPMKIRVVQPAYVPDKPFSPRKAMVMALCGMAGIFSGLMLVLGLTFIDTSIKTVDEAETMLRMPVLTTIGLIKNLKASPIVVLQDARSMGAEAFRTLRTALSMLGKVEDRRVFLFTSAMPAEGKTFCSLNYSASLAQMGLKTLLIDSDLRRPAVEIVLKGKEQGTAGVTDYLTGKKGLLEVVQKTDLENLHFISAGTTAPNPAELLAQDGLSSLLEEALRHYDRVIVDSAPIHAVSDTLLIVKSVQTVCLVVRAAKTSGRSVMRCIQLLQGAEAPLSGVILNRMPVRRGLGYGYYSPYYDYSYHGKYGKKGVYGSK